MDRRLGGSANRWLLQTSSGWRQATCLRLVTSPISSASTIFSKVIDKPKEFHQIGQMFWLLLATQLAAPFPVDFGQWFYPEDFPTELTSGEKTVFQTTTQTLVDAAGKIVGCRAETTSSSSEVDAHACAIILKRG